MINYSMDCCETKKEILNFLKNIRRNKVSVWISQISKGGKILKTEKEHFDDASVLVWITKKF